MGRALLQDAGAKWEAWVQFPDQPKPAGLGSTCLKSYLTGRLGWRVVTQQYPVDKVHVLGPAGGVVAGDSGLPHG